MNNWYREYKLAFSNPLDILAKEITNYVIRNFQLRTFELTRKQMPKLKEYGLSKIIFVVGRFIADGINKVIVSGGFDDDIAKKQKYIEIRLEIEYDKNNNLPITSYYQEIYENIRHAVRHELEHRDMKIKGTATKPEYDSTERMKSFMDETNSKYAIIKQIDYNYKYMSDNSEIDPFIRGWVNLAKQRKQNMYDLIKNELWNRIVDNLNKDIIDKLYPELHTLIKQKYSELINIYMQRIKQIYGDINYVK